MPVLFVYGTLQHPPVLLRLLGRVPEMLTAELPDHRAAPLEDRVYPGLVADPGARAHGRVLTDVDQRELATLDAFEGPEYDRIDVVAEVDGRPVPCQAWLLVGPSAQYAQRGTWSLERFVLEDAGAFLGGAVAGDVHPGAGS